jgi:hypothetical protein
MGVLLDLFGRCNTNADCSPVETSSGWYRTTTAKCFKTVNACKFGKIP